MEGGERSEPVVTEKTKVFERNHRELPSLKYSDPKLIAALPKATRVAPCKKKDCLKLIRQS